MKLLIILALFGVTSLSFAQDFKNVVKYCTSYKHPVIDDIGVTAVCASTETKNLYWIEGVHANRYRISRHGFFVTLENKNCTLQGTFTKVSEYGTNGQDLAPNLFESFDRNRPYFIYADKKNGELTEANEQGHRVGDVEKVVCQDIK